MSQALSVLALVSFIGALFGAIIWLMLRVQAYKEALAGANMTMALRQAKKEQQMHTLMDSNVALRKQIKDLMARCGDLSGRVASAAVRNVGLKLAVAELQNHQGLQQAMIRIQADALSELQSRPLKDTPDDALPKVIREELEARHQDAHLGAICFSSVIDHAEWRQDAHKLASKCGGAAFRVVDAIKRGKL